MKDLIKQIQKLTWAYSPTLHLDFSPVHAIPELEWSAKALITEGQRQDTIYTYGSSPEQALTELLEKVEFYCAHRQALEKTKLLE